MDNGALTFIVILEAIVIVWLYGKLKHYQQFERLLEAQGGDVGSRNAGGTAPAQSSTRATVPSAASAAAAAAAVTVSPESDDDLLDIHGVEPEVNIEEAKRVQLVMARCHYAEFYLEQLDDDYERGQFRHIVNSCRSTARGITDPFFRASALQPLIILLDKAGWEGERDRLLEEVDDDIIRQRILSELSSQAEES